MSESEKQAIVEGGVPTIVDQHQETAEVARDETAGPSTRPAGSGEPPGLGRDSDEEGASPTDNNDAASSSPVGDRAGNQDDPSAPETGNLKLETASSSPVGDRADNQDGPGTLETGNWKLETAKSGKPAELCHHAMESGLYCQSPALRGRSYCYSHLRLRGQRIRMARAVAQRQSLKLVLPPLDDMNSVLAALGQVADGLAAGLLPPRQADLLLYTLRQAAAALRWMARPQAGSTPTLTEALPPQAGDTGAAPPYSPAAGERACPELAEGVGKEQKRLVEEYPGFEAEFGLPAGLDLSQPPHVLFPPATQVWPSATGTAATAQPVVYNDPPPSRPVWTKEAIELEELDKRREYMSEKSHDQESCKIHARIEKQVKTEMRKEREAEWQAEADRRNALEEKKAQIYSDMDEGQRRAFQLGIMEGIETAKRDAEEEARTKKPAKAAVDSQRTVGMGRLDSR